MKSDLRNLKVGDTIFVKAKVVLINEELNYPITTSLGKSYTFDGKSYEKQQFPSAFLECPFVEVKEYEVSDERFPKRLKGIVIDNKLYIESGCDTFKEVEQKVTLEIPLSELENNPELKKYLKQ